MRLFPLSDAQRAIAATAADGCLVVAAPGSGKTTVLAERFGRRRFGRRPSKRILAVTFTRSARTELERRIDRRWGARVRTWPHGVVTFDALHSELLGYLLRCGAIVWPGRGESLDVRDSWQGVAGAEWRDGNRGQRVAVLAGRRVDSIYDRSLQPNHGFGKKEAFESQLGSGVCTHVDVRSVLKGCFRNPVTRGLLGTYLAETTDTLLVDEAFDANEVDLSVVELAYAAGVHVMLVGDPWQAIYEFRDARPADVVKLSRDQKFETPSPLVARRFRPRGLDEAMAALRDGEPVALAEVGDGLRPDVVLAPRWQGLWDGPDWVLPTCFGRIRSQTDAALVLLLDRVCDLELGVHATRREEALAVLRLDVDEFRADSPRFLGPLVARLGTEDPDVLLGLLRTTVKKDLGSPRAIRRGGARSEQIAEKRVVALSRRLGQGHIVAGYTVHQAKGREWPRVSVCLGGDGRMRLGRGLDREDEEDRVLYVALTRASESVTCA